MLSAFSNLGALLWLSWVLLGALEMLLGIFLIDFGPLCKLVGGFGLKVLTATRRGRSDMLRYARIRYDTLGYAKIR